MSKPNIDLSNMDPVMYAEYMKKEQKKKRKKTILVTFLSVFIAIIAIAGIANVLSGDAPQKVDGSNVNGSSVSTTQDYFQVGDVVKLNDWNITVNSFSFEKTVSSSEFIKYTPDNGNLYLVLDITIKNVAAVPILSSQPFPVTT